MHPDKQAFARGLGARRPLARIPPVPGSSCRAWRRFCCKPRPTFRRLTDHVAPRRPQPPHPYRYDRPIHLGPQTVRLRPAPHARTPHPAYALKVEPSRTSSTGSRTRTAITSPGSSSPNRRRAFRRRGRPRRRYGDLSTRSTSSSNRGRELPLRLRPGAGPGARALPAQAEPAGRCSPALLDRVPHGERRRVDMLVDAQSRACRRDIAYVDPHGARRPDARGDARQRAAAPAATSAWLLVQLLRHLGLAARFVSGYLIQLAADVKPLDGPERPEADFTDLHAWAEVYLPGAGWVGLDADLGPDGRRGPHPARRDARAAVGRADQRHWSDKCRDDVRASR